MAKYEAIHLAVNDIAVESSNTDAKTKALAYVRLLQSPTFIMSLVVSQFVEFFLTHPT